MIALERTRLLRIINQKGLHARAAAQFVKIVEQYESNVNVSFNGHTVGALSVMGLLMLSARRGSEIMVCASGHDAEEVLNDLEQLIQSKFGEPH